MMKNKKWILNSPFYVHWKKHYCKLCNGELTVKRIKKTVNSKSPEAKDFDFSFSGGDGGFMFGDVEFSFEIFYCSNCDNEISIKEMKKYEREQKRCRGMKSKNAVKYLYNETPFYVHWKKHFCPECGTRLKTAYDSVVVNSNSPEAKNYDFSIAAGDNHLTGDVEFRTSYFKCPKCEFSISFDEMKKLEKDKK